MVFERIIRIEDGRVTITQRVESGGKVTQKTETVDRPKTVVANPAIAPRDLVAAPAVAPPETVRGTSMQLGGHVSSPATIVTSAAAAEGSKTPKSDEKAADALKAAGAALPDVKRASAAFNIQGMRGAKAGTTIVFDTVVVSGADSSAGGSGPESVLDQTVIDET